MIAFGMRSPADELCRSFNKRLTSGISSGVDKVDTFCKGLLTYIVRDFIGHSIAVVRV